MPGVAGEIGSVRPGCRFHKRDPVSDIDIAVADGLKVPDLERPIREADMTQATEYRQTNPKQTHF
jgi:hypothetical protein